jgi:hypothetical protein
MTEKELVLVVLTSPCNLTKNIRDTSRSRLPSIMKGADLKKGAIYSVVGILIAGRSDSHRLPEPELDLLISTMHHGSLNMIGTSRTSSYSHLK